MACLPILFYFLGSKIPKKKDDPAKEKTRLQLRGMVISCCTRIIQLYKKIK